MARSDLDRITEEKIAKGGVLVLLYFDMRHQDKDKLQPLMADLINERLLKEPGMVYCYGSIEEPIKDKDSYVTSGILTVLVDSFRPLVNIMFKYAPAGIEILKPTREIPMRLSDLQSILMDISNMSIDYSRYILERVMKQEDVEAIKEHISDRENLGKKLLEQADKNKAPK